MGIVLLFTIHVTSTGKLRYRGRPRPRHSFPVVPCAYQKRHRPHYRSSRFCFLRRFHRQKVVTILHQTRSQGCLSDQPSSVPAIDDFALLEEDNAVLYQSSWKNHPFDHQSITAK
jgi:hypothetical protein